MYAFILNNFNINNMTSQYKMQIIIIICKQKVNWTNALIIYLIGDENAFSNNFCNKCKFDLFYIAHSKHVKFSKTPFAERRKSNA